MRDLMKVMAVALASTVMIGQFNQAMAFKNPLRNMVQPDQPSASQPAAQPEAATKRAPANSGPIQYNNEKFGYKVEIPGKWKQMGGDLKSSAAQFFDETGSKGSFQVNANWMSEDFPVQSSLQAMEKQYQERQKHGELTKYYRKDFTLKDAKGKPAAVFQGYITIETANDPDPDIRRMQWIGYAKGNYYNFTWSSKPEPFEAYLPEFEQIMNKIEFAQ